MSAHSFSQQLSALRASVFVSSLLAFAISANVSANAAEAGMSELAAKTLSRAEVIADLNLWRRAGVEQYEEAARYYQVDEAAYERAVAEYRRLRHGPAFAQEVAKVLGQTSSAHADAR